MTTVNGYTIVAAEYNAERKIWTILGAALVAGMAGKFSYVTARMTNLTDPEWFWGTYTGDDFGKAVESYNIRKDIS